VTRAVSDDLRDRTAAELDAFLHAVALDDPWSDEPGATSRITYAPDGFLYTAERLRLHEALLAEHLATRPVPDDEGALAVVVTAGPPGSGKTTTLARMRDLEGYRHIDADDFKDPLLERAAADGLLDHWTEHVLGDGRPVQPRELAGFVHAESTAVADTLRRRSLRNGENIVVHGTLSSVDYLDDLLSELDDAGYDRLRIVDVEVPFRVAVDQATERWWRVRERGDDPLGGRFVPASDIRSYYPEDQPTSVCRVNASALESRATALGWSVSIERIG
jgi:predicted ABC-type ATPase